jgi:hypothetical protein
MKIALKEIGSDYIDLAEYRVHWRAVVNKLIKFKIP